MSIVAIARRNWALRLSVVLNICVLLYVCAQIGSSGPWIEEPPTNWAAPLQTETYSDPLNGTQKGITSSSSSSAVSVASPGSIKDVALNGAIQHPSRMRLVTTTPNEDKLKILPKSEHSHNDTVLLSLFLFLYLSMYLFIHLSIYLFIYQVLLLLPFPLSCFFSII